MSDALDRLRSALKIRYNLPEAPTEDEVRRIISRLNATSHGSKGPSLQEWTKVVREIISTTPNPGRAKVAGLNMADLNNLLREVMSSMAVQAAPSPALGLTLSSSQRSSLQAHYENFVESVEERVQIVLAIDEPIDTRKRALLTINSLCTKFANTLEVAVAAEYSKVTKVEDPSWHMFLAETCADFLGCLLTLHEGLDRQCVELGVPRDSLMPTERAYASIQRLAQDAMSKKDVKSMRAKFAGANLPIAGFTGRAPGNRSNPMRHKVFLFGCVCLAFVAALTSWSFFVGDLTNDQRHIMRVLLALGSGIVAASFTGTITFETKGWLPAGVVGGTGGYAVWFLTAFFLRPALEPFGVVVQPHGGAGRLDTLESGEVSLQIGNEVKQESLDGKGRAHFTSIPVEFDGHSVPVRVEIPGFEMQDPAIEMTLERNGVIHIPMVPIR